LYDAGRAALLRWDLTEARRSFQAAVDEDPDYGQANLALATVMSWAGDRPADWRRHAAAAARPGALGAVDQRRATALIALAEARFPEACETYRDMVRSDSLDFGAWFGLGTCLNRDKLVVRDSRSPSGWRFRASLNEAANAFRRALETYPSAHRASGSFALKRLESVLFIDPREYRDGYALTPDTIHYAAFPSMEGDTIAFVPYPLAVALAGKGPASSPTTGRAIDRARELLREVTGSWLRAFPTNPEVLALHAKALEAAGLVADGTPAQSALAALTEARRRSRDTTSGFRLAVAETRLRIKRSEFRAARQLADSLLSSTAFAARAPAGTLAALAALTGRPTRAAQLLAKAEGSFEDAEGAPVRVGGPLAEAANAYLAYAAIGAPTDSIAATASRTRQLTARYLEPSRADSMYTALTYEAAVLAHAQQPLAARPALHGRHHLNPPLQALQAGDHATARRALRAVQSERQHGVPGSVAIDGTLVEAWMLTELKDSAAAAAHLDLSLGALATQTAALLDEPPQAAGLVRAMALRAELAAAAGDSATARRWAAAVSILWGDAEPSLRPIVARMQTLAAPTGP
jgi:hypothetical protein